MRATASPGVAAATSSILTVSRGGSRRARCARCATASGSLRRSRRSPPTATSTEHMSDEYRSAFLDSNLECVRTAWPQAVRVRWVRLFVLQHGAPHPITRPTLRPQLRHEGALSRKHFWSRPVQARRASVDTFGGTVATHAVSVGHRAWPRGFVYWPGPGRGRLYARKAWSSRPTARAFIGTIGRTVGLASAPASSPLRQPRLGLVQLCHGRAEGC